MCQRWPTDLDMDKVRSTLKQLVRDRNEEVSATSSSCDKYPSRNTILRTLREWKKERQATSQSSIVQANLEGLRPSC
jgi:hypothetical protein